MDRVDAAAVRTYSKSLIHIYGGGRLRLSPTGVRWTPKNIIDPARTRVLVEQAHGLLIICIEVITIAYSYLVDIVSNN